jgi:Secretion system C-terminal sorting domain
MHQYSFFIRIHLRKKTPLNFLNIFIVLYIGFTSVNAQCIRPIGYNDDNQPSYYSVDYTAITLDLNGTQYICYNDNINSGKCTVKKFNGVKWETVGNEGFSYGITRYNNIDIDNSGIPYVIYLDDSKSDKPYVRKYTSQTWDTVGNCSLFPSSAKYADIKIDNNGTPYIVFTFLGGSRLSVKKFNGINWVDVGNTILFSNYGCTDPHIDIDNNGDPYIVYSGASLSSSTGYSKVNVIKFTGSNWVNVGTPNFSADHAIHPNITIDNNGTPIVIYGGNAINSYKAIVKKLNGTNWVTVGNSGFSTGDSDDHDIICDASGTIYVTYSDAGNSNKVIVKKNSGATWTTVGNSNLSNGKASYCGISLDNSGNPNVIYKDSKLGDKAIVKKFIGPDWQELGIHGNVLDGVNIEFLTVDNNNVPYAIFRDQANGGRISVIKYIGNSWTIVGSPNISISTIPSLVNSGPAKLVFDKNNMPYITFFDFVPQSKVTVKKFNGTNWVDIGAVITPSNGAYDLSLAIDSTNYPCLIYTNGSTFKTVVQKFNGTNWYLLGNPSNTNVYDYDYYPQIKTDKYGNIYLTHSNGSDSGRAVVKKFNGISWTALGNTSISNSRVSYTNIFIDTNNVLYAWYYKYSGPIYYDTVFVKKFNGTTWIDVTKLAFPTQKEPVLNFSPDGKLYAIVADSANNFKLKIKLYNGINWVNVGPPTFYSSKRYWANFTIDQKGSALINLTNGGSFVYKMTNSFSFNQNINLCSGNSYSIGTNVYNMSGTYIDTLSISGGCDSIITTNLSINNVIDTSLTIANNTISSNATNALYQWINCSNYSIIVGATSQYHNPLANGNYACIIKINNCTDTSKCVNITNLKTENLTYNSTLINIQPNPANSFVKIKSNLVSNISIYSALGNLVKQIESKSEETIIDINDLPSGVYSIKIDDHYAKKLIKL